MKSYRDAADTLRERDEARAEVEEVRSHNAKVFAAWYADVEFYPGEEFVL
jgi:hypothetical protein